MKKKFLDKSKTGEMSEKTEKAFTALGVAGHLARMIAFAAYSIADARYRRV